MVIPDHLKGFSWYAPNLAWLVSVGIPTLHDPGGAEAKRANLFGASLFGASLFEADLRGADLLRANLRGADLFRADLRGANLRGADLRGADLRGANLRGADLFRANLRGADLFGADLSGADLGDVPVVEEIDVKICEEVCGMPDKLEMNVYHTCETTHSRAGWHVHLAGKKGYDLEERVGPSAAGALIYAASSLFRVPDFFATNEDALADIKERADKARMTGEVKG